VTVLHIDKSDVAHDISYDAWSRLYCGVPGEDQTCVGGGVPMECKQFSYVPIATYDPVPVHSVLVTNTDPETCRRVG